MNIVLTTILCRSGLLTHTWDLAKQLTQLGFSVGIAIKKTNDLSTECYPPLLAQIYGIPYQFYNSESELKTFCRRIKPELVHAHSPVTMEDSYALTKDLEIPLIITLHSVYAWERSYKPILDHAAQIIAVGPAQFSCVRRYKAKTHLIGNGIDINYYHPPKTKHPLKPIRVLWFGRTHGSMTRGVKALDQALAILKKENYRFKAKMVGTAQGYNPENMQYVKWTDDPLALLQWSHIAFGHGRSLRESMACGNVGFLVGCGYGGIITADWFKRTQPYLDAFPEYRLPAAKPERIAHDIKQISLKPELLLHSMHQARIVAKTHFDLTMMVKKTINVYQIARDC